MPHHDFDLLVIGAGSGGVRAARLASELGRKVAIVEQEHIGGTCVNVGCVPKKLFVYASHFDQDFKAAAGFGWSADPPHFDWPALLARKNQEIERLQGVYQQALHNAGAAVLAGHARLLDEHTVRLEGRRISAERILIATGGRPTVPDIPGKEHAVTSNAMFFLPELPKRLLIVGGGYIAAEFAGIMSGLGVRVTLCHRGAKLLRHFDEDVRDFAAAEMQKQDIDILFNCDITGIRKHGSGFGAETASGRMIEADLILYATGRKPNVENLGLEAAGVQLTAEGAIRINDRYQTSAPSIYALGDVTDRLNLTPAAIAEARALIDGLYKNAFTPVDYDHVPTAVFCRPPIAAVGLTEAQARERYGDIAVYQSEFRPMKHTLSGLDRKSLMKLIVSAIDDRVVGAHMVGADAPEIMQGLAVAIRAGATKAVFDATVGIHPTAAEEFVTMRKAKGGA